MPKKQNKKNNRKLSFQPSNILKKNFAEKSLSDTVNSLVKQNDARVSVPKNNNVRNGWLVIGGSAIGKSHRESNLPCQDHYSFKRINDFWGIAVCCDGAGSALNSHLGAQFVAEEAASAFSSKISQTDTNLPTKQEWHKLAKECLEEVKNKLKSYSEKEMLPFESLACTVIVVIYSSVGILTTHIGDGRAGYLTKENQWKALITPWKGEEANQTVFITSDIWTDKIDDYCRSSVFNDTPLAFTLMSDGCESHSFECSVLNQETKEWSDPNIPYAKFFNPVLDSLKQMNESGLPYGELQQKWIDFLSSGTKGLLNEADDKTLIIGMSLS